MIERKKFLELCQRNAVYPDSVEVAFRALPNVFYNPRFFEYLVWIRKAWRGTRRLSSKSARRALFMPIC